MQTSNQRTQNNNVPLTRLNPFGTFLSESLPHSGQHAPRAFSPPLRLLETWSPCSRPFAILPVSAVSDAQKLATGNFLHVRAESLSLPGRHTSCAFLPLRGFLRRLRRLLSAALPPFGCLQQRIAARRPQAAIRFALRRCLCRDGKQSMLLLTLPLHRES